MSNITERKISEYKNQNYPDAALVSYDEKAAGLSFYTAQELQSVEDDWFPLGCYKDKESGRVVYGGVGGIYHTYIQGQTGAGKTTRLVIQSIHALASLKGKPSFLVSDPYGEVCENSYDYLKERGYIVKIINADEPSRSDTYNPFFGVARDCLREGEITDDANNVIRRMAEVINPIESKNDPIWDIGARSYTQGLILDKFEDLLDGNLPIDCLTIYNIIQNHHWLRANVEEGYDRANLRELRHYKNKSLRAEGMKKMIAVINNAGRTRASYFGVVENRYDVFEQNSVFRLSSNSTVDIEEFLEKPTAIFVKCGGTSTGDSLVSLMVNEIYSKCVSLGGKEKTKALPRKIHCFLDEFANLNIASSDDYIRMLTTSRKFGMFWHMFVQCDAQIDKKFDEHSARTIRSNCTEIFMGSNDHQTLTRFAESCGKKTVTDFAGEAWRGVPEFNRVLLLDPEALRCIDPGYVYIRTANRPIIKSYFEPFYTCSEFGQKTDILSVYPKNDFDYKSTMFTPDDIFPEISGEAFEILEYIRKGITTLWEIKAKFDSYDIEKILKELEIRRLIIRTPDMAYKARVTEKQYRLLKYRYENAPKQKEASEDDFSQIDLREYVPQKPKFIFDFSDGVGDPSENLVDDTDKHRERKKAGYAKYYEENKDQIPIEKIDALTSVSISFKNFAKWCCIGSLSGFEAEPTLFVYVSEALAINDVLGELIGNNKLMAKSKLVSMLEDEISTIRAYKLLPPEKIKTHELALKTLKKDYTVSMIKRIKNDG